MIKAIFFDQDNTVLDTKKVSMEVYRKSISAIAESVNIDKADIFEEWRRVLDTVKTSSDPKERFFAFSLKLALENLGANHFPILQAMDVFKDTLRDLITLTPGTADFFADEKQLLYILFTEDSAEINKVKMGKFSSELEFDLIVTSDDIGRMKPDERYVASGWEKFNLKPEECIYVGDSWEKDCQIGQERGGIGVVFGSDDERADHSISNMMELVRIIEDNQ
ncbi:MAG: HAD family hydrolase [Candidatus Dojkabacteria bacterium]